MVIDTSAVIAVLLGEKEAKNIIQVIADDPKRIMSSFSYLESSIVIEAKKGEIGGRELDLFIHRAEIEIINMNLDQANLARSAWRKFGKGRHSAGLNIGDCCSYALSAYSGEPILFKGNDFSQTDLTQVSY